MFLHQGRRSAPLQLTGRKGQCFVDLITGGRVMDSKEASTMSSAWSTFWLRHWDFLVTPYSCSQVFWTLFFMFINAIAGHIKVLQWILAELFVCLTAYPRVEDETDPFKIPTKQNIRKALRWLVHGCQSGDSLVFHYSGHSSRQRDYDKDELDGFDEALCPLDHETEGLIIDDEINATIVRPLSRGVTLHTIIDACYSGTMLDLQFLCRMNRSLLIFLHSLNIYLILKTSICNFYMKIFDFS